MSFKQEGGSEKREGSEKKKRLVGKKRRRGQTKMGDGSKKWEGEEGTVRVEQGEVQFLSTQKGGKEVRKGDTKRRERSTKRCKGENGEGDQIFLFEKKSVVFQVFFFCTFFEKKKTLLNKLRFSLVFSIQFFFACDKGFSKNEGINKKQLLDCKE